MSYQNISIFGLGYIGLPTAAIIASKGLNVIGIDVNTSVVETINQGKIHIVEPDLDVMVQRAVKNGHLTASLLPQPADVFIIAVPTPFKSDKSGDTTYIKAAAKALASQLKKGDLIILESTSPVGTTEWLAQWLAEFRTDLRFPNTATHDLVDVHVAYCPERVLPGRVLHELIHNDRVIGGLTPECSVKAHQFYKLFVQGECVISNARTAEMAKLTENSFRDVNIAFANELSMICDQLDINVWELIELANRHPRVNILNPGPGVGGHCIAVDPWFIIARTPETAHLIKAARSVNDSKPKWVIEKVLESIESINSVLKKSNKSATVACYGLSFKADIDDLRESPALNIAQYLSDQLEPNTLLVVEPHIENLPKALAGKAKLVSLDFAREKADIHALLVDHTIFKGKIPSEGCIIDTKGIWNTKKKSQQTVSSLRLAVS